MDRYPRIALFNLILLKTYYESNLCTNCNGENLGFYTDLTLFPDRFLVGS